MGSQISVVVACQLVHGFLRGTGAGQLASSRPRFWKQYVDDTSCIMVKDEVEP